MTPREKAERARLLMDDPIMEAVFADIRMGLVSKLEHAPLGDTETQHEITLMLQLLKRLKTQLQTYVQDEVVEKHHQKHESFIRRMTQKLA
jgi:hypothetical protein